MVYEHKLFYPDRLFMMQQSPSTFYLYWRISEEKIKLLEELFYISWRSTDKFIFVYDQNNEVLIKEYVRDDHLFVKNVPQSQEYISNFNIYVRDQYIPLLRSNSIIGYKEDHKKIEVSREDKEENQVDEFLDPFCGYSYYPKC